LLEMYVQKCRVRCSSCFIPPEDTSKPAEYIIDISE
jgi:hypothetical protein